MEEIVSVDWLADTMKEGLGDIVIVDVRFELTDDEAGRKAYLNSHIPNAVYLDLDKDLSGKAQKHGGNHPLPDMETFTAKLGHIGIGNNTTVVVYGKGNDMFAGRLWWLLHYVGHDNVYLLDGGFDEWIGKGYDISTDIPKLEPKTFTPRIQEEEAVDIEQVKEKLDNQSAILIDSRSKARYLGETEPLYAKAGHIPGAKNYFWKNVLDESGKWKNKEELAVNFKDLSKDKEIIVSCGSGVSATPNVLALKAAGFKNVKLYPGSYSDWISYEDNKVEKKEA
ncbi:sulfurtransferase [Virgibacillus siamensis]|uniref:sulfurtransferase n=1 Tax=Virgibacillus siamensis TaxID=480071 RepID=UPI000984D114|nr:sulfurtransferase [Virgibacillus siamensis]